MRKNTLISTVLLLLAFTPLFSQTHKCGVTFEMGNMIRSQIIENRNELRDYVTERSATVYLPVRFFMVANNDGSDRTSELSALRSLCILNENYAEQEIQFYLEEFVYLNNSTLLENPGGSFGYISNQMNNRYNAINVFVVNQIGDSSNGITLAYYQPPASGPNRNDWLVAAENYLDNFEVLTHEIGHYFSLNHTFFGWETSEWENNVPAPNSHFYAGETVITERANGSNCATSADMICDTPADYLHMFDQGCSYKDNALDPTGSPINPDPQNFMTYNNNSCNPDLYFTPNQKSEISNSLNSSSRNYLPKNNTPNLNEITGTPTLLYPLAQNPPVAPNSVTFEWTSVPNATHYYLEITKPGNPPLRYVVEGANQYTVTDLVSNSNFYFWKVTPFNDYHTCAATSIQASFKTGGFTDTNEISDLKDWNIQPNPVKKGELLNITLASYNSITLDVNVTTITGQTILTYKDQKFGAGNSLFEIETTGIPSGIYLVTLRTNNGFQTKRISIL